MEKQTGQTGQMPQTGLASSNSSSCLLLSALHLFTTHRQITTIIIIAIDYHLHYHHHHQRCQFLIFIVPQIVLSWSCHTLPGWSTSMMSGITSFPRDAPIRRPTPASDRGCPALPLLLHAGSISVQFPKTFLCSPASNDDPTLTINE